MMIGLVSDSHGQSERLARAVRELVERGAAAIAHCGDLGDAECLRVLGGAGVPAYAVAGNMDSHVPHLDRVAAGCGVVWGERTVEVDLGDGRHLIATHGHHEQLMAELIAGRQFAYLCHGHTHLRREARVGPMKIINPGAIHRARPHSAALLDTDSGDVTFLDIA